MSATMKEQTTMTSSDNKTKPFDVTQFIQDVTTYLDQADAYTRSNDAPPPDAALLRRQLPPDGSILDAEPGADAHGPYIAVRIRDARDPRRKVTPRLFDPWYFLTIVLLALAGVPMVWHKKKQKSKWYYRVMLRTPKGGPRDGIPVDRWIAGTKPKIETPSERGHLEHRRGSLTTRGAAKRPHPPKYGRDDILRRAPGLMDGAELIPRLLAATLQALLERALDVADRIHDKRHPSAEAE